MVVLWGVLFFMSEVPLHPSLVARPVVQVVWMTLVGSWLIVVLRNAHRFAVTCRPTCKLASLLERRVLARGCPSHQPRAPAARSQASTCSAIVPFSTDLRAASPIHVSGKLCELVE